MANTQQTPPAPTAPKTSEEIMALVRRAQQGDQATLPALRELLKEPWAVNLCGGDLAREAECAIINMAAGANLAFKEAILRKLELMRAELAGPSPTPLERLLVERVVACWLQLNEADIRLTHNEHKLTIAQGEYNQRSRDRAHSRYLSALRTLAVVRKLALHVLQVNIARKQVNVAGPTA